ncbi:MAG: hypothetical protein EOO92_20585 [Pedobacter sp.]|nr:MAG: hypothetical protein EOO92_20585 [Pedobacter sp.]
METLNRKANSKMIIGIFFIIAGLLFFGRNLGLEIPFWIVSWKTFLITLGIAIGYKRNFKPGGWIILILVGSIFLMKSIFPIIFLPVYKPLLLIGLGLFLIFKPWNERNNFWCEDKKRPVNFDGPTHEK